MQTACGFGVPLLHEAVKKGAGAIKGKCTADEMALEEATPGFHTREVLENFYLTLLRKDERSLEKYKKENNSKSMDGLPGLRTARRDNGEWLKLEDTKVRIGRLLRQWDAIMLGVVFTLLSMTALRVLNVNV